MYRDAANTMSLLMHIEAASIFLKQRIGIGKGEGIDERRAVKTRRCVFQRLKIVVKSAKFDMK
jgi:hypothetical protein